MTPNDVQMQGMSRKISIHTPNKGSDTDKTAQDILTEISIHTPNKGSDLKLVACIILLNPFQSTLPIKGVTLKTITTSS